MLNHTFSFNPFRQEEEREHEERKNAPTSPPSETTAGKKGWKRASEKDKILLFELIGKKDPEEVIESLIVITIVRLQS